MPADTAGDGDHDDATASPDDYNQKRRLRQIHNARSQVPKVRRDGYEMVHDTQTTFRETDYHRYVAESVIEYAIELEPIAHRTDAAVFSKPLPDRGATIADVLDTGGRADGEYITLSESRWIKRQLDRFMAEVGLGVEIDDGDEWKV